MTGRETDDYLEVLLSRHRRRQGVRYRSDQGSVNLNQIIRDEVGSPSYKPRVSFLPSLETNSRTRSLNPEDQYDRYRKKIAQLQNEKERAEFRLKTVEKRYQKTIDNLAADNAVLERKVHKTESELSTLRPLTMQTNITGFNLGSCTNCHQKSPTHVIDCGHLVCARCCKQSFQDKCAVCDEKPETVIKINYY